MYAVIETGGKQFRVAAGDTIHVDTLPGEIGSEVEFSRVLAVVNDGQVTNGPSATVKAKIVAHDRAEKILVFKFTNVTAGAEAVLVTPFLKTAS